MTARVVQCQRGLGLAERRPALPSATPLPTRGFRPALLTALVLVPLAGAAEAPQGWSLATLSALAILLLLALAGGRAPWGWITLGLGLIALFAPLGLVAGLGPGLFVAAALSLVAWLANRGRARELDQRRPPPGSWQRAAQLSMGLSGERYVAQVLAREMTDDFVLINSLKLPRGAGDIDHLVVGPTGVFVLETKTMAGLIECDPDGTWRRTRTGRAGGSYPAYIGNPAAQVQRNIYAARECLRTRLPALFRGTPLWLEGLVVFAHPRTVLATEHSRVPAVLLPHVAERISSHVPRRRLRPDEVDAVVDALLVEGRERGQLADVHAQSAQALVEAALALPVVLVLLFGTLGLSRIVQAQTAVVATVHEAARAGALASSPDDAVERMRRRVALVSPGLGLNPRNLVLDWDVSNFAGDRARVVAVVRYAVDLGDLPLADWVPRPILQAEHAEWVDPFRSGIVLKPDAGR